jgi:cytochrome c
MNDGSRTLKSLMVAAALAIGAAISMPLASQPEPPATVKSALEKRAETLLEIAVQHVKEKGEAGARDFSRQSAFVDRDLYAYALRTDGLFLASGGSSAALVGDNVLNQTDSDGKPFFREMVDIATKEGGGRVEYRWFNPADSSGEPKVTLFRKVGDIIVAVGFYPPRATPRQAKALLTKAVDALGRDPKAALAEFQQFNGPFVRNDLYVFVVDTDSGRFLAHGASPQMVGTDGFALSDPTGKPILREMLAIAGKDGEGEMDYYWRNPATGRIESKHSFFRVVQGRLVGVGSYNR